MSATVLLHHPHAWAAPAGVWWLKAGRLRREYLPGFDHLETIALMTLQGLADDVDWTDYVERKATSAPYASTWSSAELDEEAEPADLLRLMQ